MSVRFRLALTVFLTGLATALGVIVTVVVAFQRFDHESSYQRADAFLSRVMVLHDDLLAQHERNPEEFTAFLRNLVLYEPDTQLYLLDADGTVLASTTSLESGFKVALGPVTEAVEAAALGDRQRAAYVMGQDPQFMDADAVVAARMLKRAVIRQTVPTQGYLYLVCRKGGGLPESRSVLLRSSLASPALLSVVAVILLTSALAAWIIVTVTRPLRVLSDDVAAAAREGFGGSAGMAPAPAAAGAADEFSRLRSGLNAMLATLRLQWDELRRLDNFRRESVSNLSHDLRSPLTATVACLETLERRWSGDAARDDDHRLVAVALRNTRNAAGMVRSLGDLALLDEPLYTLRKTRLDLGEVLDDITLRFAERTTERGLTLTFEQHGDTPPVATVDVELFERAVANLLDNALKFTPRGHTVRLCAERRDASVVVSVVDTGRGIAAGDLPHLFDRLYQSRESVAPATSDEGKGLGLAIVKRIAELHGGSVAVVSTLGQGTTVTLELPAG